MQSYNTSWWKYILTRFVSVLKQCIWSDSRLKQGIKNDIKPLPMCKKEKSKSALQTRAQGVREIVHHTVFYFILLKEWSGLTGTGVTDPHYTA